MAAIPLQQQVRTPGGPKSLVVLMLDPGGFSTPTGGYAPAGGGGAYAAGVSVDGDLQGGGNGGDGSPGFAYPLIGEPGLNPFSN